MKSGPSFLCHSVAFFHLGAGGGQAHFWALLLYQAPSEPGVLSCLPLRVSLLVELAMGRRPHLPGALLSSSRMAVGAPALPSLG